MIKNRIPWQYTEPVGKSLQKKHNLRKEFAEVSKYNILWTNSVGKEKINVPSALVDFAVCFPGHLV